MGIKDKNHILKLESHIGCVKKYESDTQIRVSISDIPTVISLSKRFNWKTNKTKLPPTIPLSLSNDQIFCIVDGFIDGDGCISKRGHLRIKCDKSWVDILHFFYTILTGDIKHFNLTSDNCSVISITKDSVLRDIKNRALNLDLPIMKRKWDRLLGGVLRCDKSTIVSNFITDGVSDSRIMEITGFSYSLIYKVRRELRRSED